MGRSKKSKRVSWASDDNLCQVRLFLSEEAPSQFESSAQNQLQEKESWASVPTGMVLDENLPPGFEGSQPANTWRSNSSQIRLIKWKCAPKFITDEKWKMAAGEESKEAEMQMQREMSLLEAVYPRPSDIPSDPFVVLAEDSSHYHPGCPLIPMIPIEDENAAADQLNDSAAVNSAPTPETSSFDPEVLAAAHSALSSLMGNNTQGNIISNELLMKILTDPKIVEKMVRNNGTVTNTQPAPPPQNDVQIPPPPANMQWTLPSATQGFHMPGMPNNSFRAMSPAVSLPPRPPLGVFYPYPRGVPAANIRPQVHETVQGPLPPLVSPMSRDMNYYKNLIQQHGGERQDSMPQPPGIYNHSNHHLLSSNNFKPRDLRPKLMKPCIYFNTPRGCRNGANCTFLHDASIHQQVVVSNSIPDSQNAKRMKLVNLLSYWRMKPVVVSNSIPDSQNAKRMKLVNLLTGGG